MDESARFALCIPISTGIVSTAMVSEDA
jgi:hypothetical protein